MPPPSTKPPPAAARIAMRDSGSGESRSSESRCNESRCSESRCSESRSGVPRPSSAADHRSGSAGVRKNSGSTSKTFQVLQIADLEYFSTPNANVDRKFSKSQKNRGLGRFRAPRENRGKFSKSRKIAGLGIFFAPNAKRRRKIFQVPEASRTRDDFARNALIDENFPSPGKSRT